MLRAHVWRTAADITGFGDLIDILTERIGLFQFGESEIDNLDVIIIVGGRENDILRFQIAMHHILAMGKIKGIEDLFKNFRSAIEREGTFGFELIFETVPLDEIHNKKWLTLFAHAKIEKLDDVMVIDLGDCSGFSVKSLQCLRVGHFMRMKHFDGDGSIRLFVISPVNHTHAAFSKNGLDQIAIRQQRPHVGIFIGINGLFGSRHARETSKGSENSKKLDSEQEKTN